MRKIKTIHNLQRVDVQYILENFPNLYHSLVIPKKTRKNKYYCKSDALFFFILFITCSVALKVTFDGFCFQPRSVVNNAIKNVDVQVNSR